MTDLYADLPPKERRHRHDAFRPKIKAKQLAISTLLIALPGLCIGAFQLRYEKPFAALIGISILLLGFSYVIASSILFQFTETMQHGIHLKRKEPIRYWFNVGFLGVIYIFICAGFIGI